jgi:hypothetical protein
MPIRDQLAQCEEHTRRVLGQGAANRLANWRQYEQEGDLVQFIQRTIRNQDNLANGWELDRQGLVSLELIVITNPRLFTTEDVQIAMRTLGRQ